MGGLEGPPKPPLEARGAPAPPGRPSLPAPVTRSSLVSWNFASACILGGVWFDRRFTASPRLQLRPRFPGHFRFVGRAQFSRKTERAQVCPHEELSLMSFTSFDLHPDLLRAVDALGY